MSTIDANYSISNNFVINHLHFHHLHNPRSIEKNLSFCEQIWDGIYRWPSSKPNQIVSIACTKIFASTDVLNQLNPTQRVLNSSSQSNQIINRSDQIGLDTGEVDLEFTDDGSGENQQEESRLVAKRFCQSDGQWGWNNWTNYSDCLSLLAKKEKDSFLTDQIQLFISYSILILLIISLICLICSITIFITFK
ncbi:hypothetical protein NH340_JMT08129 [Sarcoptes scabiei]|nr:hypothetical protein NH340_JMT08129 [Sarcoptes scabiei]